MSLQSMQQIGQYQALSELGHSGMCVVYKAYQPSLGRYVALKVLMPHPAQDRAFVERFLREARIMAALQHPGIFKIFEVGQDAPYFIAMELVAGETLHELIRQQGKIPLDCAASILSQVARALDYLHQTGVVQIDLKPYNIMVDKTGNAVLMGFMARPGTTMGALEYAAPELVMGLPAGPAADIYALAVVLYEAVTGRLPFYGDLPERLYQIVRIAPRPPRQIDPRLPKAVEQVMLKGLAKQPHQRYATAVDFARDFEAAVYGRRAAPRTPA